MTTTKKVALLIGLLGLASCVTSAPPLPADTTSLNRVGSLSINDFAASDQAMSCRDIQDEMAANTTQIDADNKVIESNRTQNQVAGYFAALVVVPIVAVNTNSDEKDEIASLQKRQETLMKLTSLKGCKSVANLKLSRDGEKKKTAAMPLPTIVVECG